MLPKGKGTRSGSATMFTSKRKQTAPLLTSAGKKSYWTLKSPTFRLDNVEP
jgi:hypothetical protein